MNNFSIKSIILGMGIGVIFTSLISLVYFSGIQPEVTREMLSKKANEYGLRLVADSNREDFQGIFYEDEEENTGEHKSEEESVKIDSDSSQKTDEIEEFKNIVEPEIKTIFINRGDNSKIVANKFKQSGLIDDTEEFEQNLKDLGLANRIQIGEFRISTDLSIVDMIKIITNR